MCGIVGYVSNRCDKDKIIIKMTERIKHRGPDGNGYYIDNDIALGHVRLSIIDLDGGGQPIYNEDESKVIIFNGEIYNYQELREELKDKHKFKTNSDTEVIIHGYEEWGYDISLKLRGMFAFAIWDKDTKKLFMSRDHFGIKPLYYGIFNNNLIFASEIKAFLDNPDFKKEFNSEILLSYLCFNSVSTEEMFFKGIYRLNPGSNLIYENGKIKIQKYFKLEFTPDNDMAYEDAVIKISNAFKSSVNYHKISDVPLGSFLSSGIDSSYIVSLLKPDETYTVGYNNKSYDEVSYAKELTEKLNINNTDYLITKEEYLKELPRIIYYMDLPLGDPAAISLYFAAKIASKDVKVVLSGEGADELFGGYNVYLEEVDMPMYMKIPYGIRHFLAKIASHFEGVRGFNFVYRRGMPLEDYYIGLGRVFNDKEALNILKDKKQIRTKDIVMDTYLEYNDNSNLEKRQAIDFYYFLVNDFLHAVDRNTMMFSLEARVPFLDKEVYDIAKKLPTSFKVDKNITKKALRESSSKVIPNDAYKKKKLGFPVPLREWIREDDLYGKIKEAFNTDVANKFFDTKKILKMLERCKNKKEDNYKKIWVIYVFILWYQEYFIGD